MVASLVQRGALRHIGCVNLPAVARASTFDSQREPGEQWVEQVNIECSLLAEPSLTVVQANNEREQVQNAIEEAEGCWREREAEVHPGKQAVFPVVGAG